MKKRKISNIRILKRTFEGKADPIYNASPLTSAYYPSYPWIVLYDLEKYSHNPLSETKKTKAEAEEYVMYLKKEYEYEDKIQKTTRVLFDELTNEEQHQVLDTYMNLQQEKQIESSIEKAKNEIRDYNLEKEKDTNQIHIIG